MPICFCLPFPLAIACCNRPLSLLCDCFPSKVPPDTTTLFLFVLSSSVMSAPDSSLRGNLVAAASSTTASRSAQSMQSFARWSSSLPSVSQCAARGHHVASLTKTSGSSFFVLTGHQSVHGSLAMSLLRELLGFLLSCLSCASRLCHPCLLLHSLMLPTSYNLPHNLFVLCSTDLSVSTIQSSPPCCHHLPGCTFVSRSIVQVGAVLFLSCDKPSCLFYVCMCMAYIDHPRVIMRVAYGFRSLFSAAGYLTWKSEYGFECACVGDLAHPCVCTYVCVWRVPCLLSLVCVALQMLLSRHHLARRVSRKPGWICRPQSIQCYSVMVVGVF